MIYIRMYIGRRAAYTPFGKGRPRMIYSDNRCRPADALLTISDGPAIFAVVGCGGKTTFIGSLARASCGKKVLISPTTKIRPMTEPGVALCQTLDACKAHVPARSIQCLGISNGTSGKLEALPPDLLAAIAPGYDLVLLEADGSRGLPCKGWLASEPVIPPYCTHTVGIVTLKALGKPADERNVLRLPEFLKLTGLHRGDVILEQALARMVCGAEGMFRNAVGKQCLFVNQVEDEHAAAAARAFLLELRAHAPGRFFRLAYGSARSDCWTEV